MARDEVLAEVWYNVGHLALGIGDVNLAYQCYRLAIAAHADHAESYNNLGIIHKYKPQSRRRGGDLANKYQSRKGGSMANV